MRTVPSNPLLTLLNLFGAHCNGSSWASVSEVTERWVPGTLQYQVVPKEELEAQREKAWTLLRQLNLVEPILLTTTEAEELRRWTYARAFMLCGATLTAMRKRLAFGNAQWPPDVLCSMFVALGSIRTRDPKRENWREVTHPTVRDADGINIEYKGIGTPNFIPMTEYELMLQVCEETQLGEALRHNARMFIPVCAPARPIPSDPKDRLSYRPEPSFADTLRTFVQGWEELVGRPLMPLAAVFAASQPACNRFEWEAAKILPQGSFIRCIGYGAPATATVSQMLNEVGLAVRGVREWLQQ